MKYRTLFLLLAGFTFGSCGNQNSANVQSADTVKSGGTVTKTPDKGAAATNATTMTEDTLTSDTSARPQ